MNGGILLLLMLILGVEPIIIGVLLSDYSLASMLPLMGLVNIGLLIIYSLVSYTAQPVETTEAVVTKKPGSYLFFPIFVIFTLAIDSFFIALPNIYGYITMLVAALVFFTTIVMEYNNISTHGVYLGNRKIMPKDYVFWISLFVASIVWFMLGDMRSTFKLMLSLWTLFLVMVIAIHGMNLIKKNSIWKLVSVKFTLLAALLATCVSALHTYMLVTDNRANFSDIPTLLYTGVQGLLHSGSNSSQVLSGSLNQSGLVSTGNMMTGFALSGTAVAGTGETLLSGATGTTPPATTGDVLTGTTVDLPLSSDTTASTVTSSEPLTFRTVLSHLVSTYKLTALKNAQTKFENVSLSDPDYRIFNVAAQRKLIGKNIKPEALVSCDTYMVLKGLSEKWNVTVGDSPFAPYWQEGVRRNEINGCTQGSLVTQKNL